MQGWSNKNDDDDDDDDYDSIICHNYDHNNVSARGE